MSRSLQSKSFDSDFTLRKRRVLFVGSFMQKSESGHVGGQMFACNTLVESDLLETVEFVPIDSTASSNLARSFLERLLGGVRRVTLFLKYLVTKKIDTVLVFCSSGLSFLEKGLMIRLAKAFGKKTILAPRSGHLLDDLSRSKFYNRQAKHILSASDYIICQGNFWREYFGQRMNVDNSKLKVIHNWIPDKGYHRRPRVGTRMQILFMGWIEKNKGIYELLDAAVKLKDRDIRWILGGEGSESKSILLKIAELGLEDRISIEGWIFGEKKKKLLRESHLFILPSHREGLPNALLEAMCCGLPAIATDVGAISDIVQTKVNGYLIQPGDSDEIVKAVEYFIDHSDEIQAHGDKARMAVLKHNSIDNAVSKFGEIL